MEPILPQQDRRSEDKTQPCSKVVSALSPWMCSLGSLHSSNLDLSQLTRKASASPTLSLAPKEQPLLAL